MLFKKMTAKKPVLFILAAALVFGMALFGCHNSTGAANNESGVNSSLNGTWVNENRILKLNNGLFEIHNETYPLVKGSYTTKKNNITITPTHIHSSSLKELPITVPPTIPPNWYPKSLLLSVIEFALKEYIGNEILVSFLMKEISRGLDDAFSPKTGTYSVSGNELTLIIEGETSIYNRQ